MTWGHKLTVFIYVPGDVSEVQKAIECVEAQLLVPNATFIGSRLDAVEDEPRDQAVHDG